ncbi:hypothetical protein AB1N83_012972 [Pleurotus pulmonarius]
MLAACIQAVANPLNPCSPPRNRPQAIPALHRRLLCVESKPAETRGMAKPLDERCKGRCMWRRNAPRGWSLLSIVLAVCPSVLPARICSKADRAR